MALGTDNQIRREECREECLRFLAERAALAHSPAAVRRGVNREGANFSLEEISDALGFLVSFGHAVRNHAMLGASTNYQVTAAGRLAHERSGY